MSLIILFILLTFSVVINGQKDDHKIHKIQMNNTIFPLIQRDNILSGLTPYGYRGDVKRIHKALYNQIYNQKELHISILGASIVTGYGLNDGKNRYSNVLRGYLEEIFGVKVYVHNLAIRAAASQAQANLLFQKSKMSKLLLSSLVLVDISVNDRPSHRDVKNEAMKVSNFKDVNSTKGEKVEILLEQEKVFAEGRMLMKLLLHSLPSTVGIAYFETFVSGGR